MVKDARAFNAFGTGLSSTAVISQGYLLTRSRETYMPRETARADGSPHGNCHDNFKFRGCDFSDGEEEKPRRGRI